MDKETLIEMMKSEYPSSYEGIKDRINEMDVKEISDMMEFLDMSIGDQSEAQDSGIMATDDAKLVSFNDPMGTAGRGDAIVDNSFIEERGMAAPGESDSFIDDKGSLAFDYRDPNLVDEYEKYVYDMLEQGLEPMSFEQFRSMPLAGEAKAPTEEVEEEIKEKKVITLAQGGIASLTGA